MSIESQITRIQAEEDAKHLMEDKSEDYIQGFHDGCEWLNEYVRTLLEKLSED